MLAEHSVQEVNPIPVEFLNIISTLCVREACWQRIAISEKLFKHQVGRDFCSILSLMLKKIEFQ